MDYQSQLIHLEEENQRRLLSAKQARDAQKNASGSDQGIAAAEPGKATDNSSQQQTSAPSTRREMPAPGTDQGIGTASEAEKGSALAPDQPSEEKTTSSGVGGDAERSQSSREDSGVFGRCLV